jgi:chemotaxis protein histidine kinase CheA
MAISRPLLIALAVAVLALAGFYATQGARNASESDSANVAAPVTPEPAPEPQAVETRQQADASTAQTKPDANGAKAKADKAEPPRSDARAKRDRAKRAVSGPAAARRAIRANKTVVLFFHGPESADETATAKAVAGLEGKRGVAVMKVPIERLNAYRDLIGQLGIAQAPAVVIVGRDRAARVIEGYIDPPTLAQDVADAR